MPISKQLAQIQELAQNKERELLLANEQHSDWLQLHFSQLSDQVHQILAVQVQQSSQVMVAEAAVSNKSIKKEAADPVADQIKTEEYQAVLQKLQAVAHMPAGFLESQHTLYLEQQLSDLLDFTVASDVEGNHLPSQMGKMLAQPHLPRFPGDTLDSHDQVMGAGLGNKGFFGWFSKSGTLDEAAAMRERYCIGAPLLSLPNWSETYVSAKKWWAFKKVVIVNPFDEVAIVACVADVGPRLWVHGQFTASPELIVEGKIWSQKARGYCLVFLVDDPNDQVALGPVKLGGQS